LLCCSIEQRSQGETEQRCCSRIFLGSAQIVWQTWQIHN
jgi:hypothetical protein